MEKPGNLLKKGGVLIAKKGGGIGNRLLIQGIERGRENRRLRGGEGRVRTPENRKLKGLYTQTLLRKDDLVPFMYRVE